MTGIVGFNFKQSAIIKYDLCNDDLVFLNWLLGFASYIKVETIKENDEIYFWIKYSKVIKDLPYMFKNVYAVSRIIKKLSDSSKPSPLIQKLVSSQRGIKTYFAFNPIIMDELGGKEMTSLFHDAPIQPKINVKDKDYHKVPYNKNVLEILKTLKLVKENGKPLFINHILPTDDHHYNATFEKFQDAMLCLYEGRFLIKYSIDKLESWFSKKYKYYLETDKIKFVIYHCKGRWDLIKALLETTAENYSKWFDIDKEQSDKTKLPRSINDWIYSPHTGTSMFYVSLLNPPTSAREADAEKIYNKIHPLYKKIFNPIYQEEWDGFTFWNKINNLIKWYWKYADELCRKDSNCSYWLSCGTVDFLDNYKKWLLEFTDNKPFLKNIGINNNTFDLYIKQKIKDHGIEIEIPRSI